MFTAAAANPDLKAAVVFYGSTPPEEKLTAIQCPVFANYGESDTQITSRVSETKELMKKYGKSFEPKIYPGAAHAFFNETGEAYNELAAADAWRRTLAFFHQHLD